MFPRFVTSNSVYGFVMNTKLARYLSSRKIAGSDFFDLFIGEFCAGVSFSVVVFWMLTSSAPIPSRTASFGFSVDGVIMGE